MKNIPYIDVHTHQNYGDAKDIISIRNCIVSKDYLHDQCCSAGIHPWYIDQNTEAQLATLEIYASKKQVLAIGECGLDKLTATIWEKQYTVFEAQTQLAESIKKPLILHTVRAFQETISLLQTQKITIPVVFHGFNKNKLLATDLLKRGYYISLGTDILKKKLDDLICELPLKQLFLETDDKNTSIKEIYTYFCAVRKINVEQLKHQLYSNYRTVFNK